MQTLWVGGGGVENEASWIYTRILLAWYSTNFVPMHGYFVSSVTLKLVKSFVLLVWDTRKNKLYGDQDVTTPGCSCPLTGNLTSSTRVYGYVVNGV